MKKTLALFVLTGCMGLLNAQGNYGGQGQMQGQPMQGQPMMQGGNQGGYQNSYQGGSSYSGSTQQNGSQGQYAGVSDQALSSQIQNMLSSPQYQNKYSNVTANLNSGNVTLQGMVNSQDDKDSLGALIGGINGVKSVSNQVTIQGQVGGQGYGPQSGYQGYSPQGNYNGSNQGNYQGNYQGGSPQSGSPQSNY